MHKEAPDGPQMSEQHPAGRPELTFKSGFYSSGMRGGVRGDEWTLLHGQSSWLRASVSCFPGWITPLLLVLCSEHSYACTSVSKNIECWSLLETRTALCFVFSVVTHPQHSKLFLPWVLWGLQDLHAIPIESGLCSWLDRLRETGWPRLPTLWQTLELPGMHS